MVRKHGMLITREADALLRRSTVTILVQNTE
jgi:hypothetical protein